MKTPDIKTSSEQSHLKRVEIRRPKLQSKITGFRKKKLPLR